MGNLTLLRGAYVAYSLLHRSGYKHAAFLKKHRVFQGIGDRCFWQPWKIPNDAKMIRLHSNVFVASSVSLICHDVINQMLNNFSGGGTRLPDYHSGIEVFDNVFIGARSVILPGVKIGPNAIVAAGSVVNRDVPEGSIVGGNPAKVIGSFEELHKKRLEMALK